MEQIFDQNFAIIERRWPELAQEVGKADLSSIDVELVEGQDNTLSVKGIQLTSKYDRSAEAKMQAATIPQQPEIHIYGTGLGDLQRAVLSRKNLKAVHVHVMNRAIFAMGLHLIEQTDWLGDKRVQIHLEEKDSVLREPLFSLPADLELTDDHSIKTRHHLISHLTTDLINAQFDPKNPILRSRLESNYHLIDRDKDVRALYGTFPDSTFFVAAAGPTLERNIGKMKQLLKSNPGYKLIAVDTASRTLLNNGIIPDVYVTIDMAIEHHHLPEVAEHQTKLVYYPLIDPDVLESWQGERFASYSDTNLYQELIKLKPRGLLYCGGSVIHPAIDLAYHMGASDIVLFGADFGYPGGKTHSGWDDGDLGPWIEEASSWTINGRGEKIRSDPQFDNYRCNLEGYIAYRPNTRFWNSSLEGAYISGCKIRPEFSQ